MTLEELCANDPKEFLDFMKYSRELSFTADPDYAYCIGLFTQCMKRHNYNEKDPDFIWNKNRLALEKDAIKK